ncbi:MAG: hypothetical protein ABIJ48_01500 [Actinomycetota bacterium]
MVTREMVGARSPLPVHGDVRLFADTTRQPGASFGWPLGEGEVEGGILSVGEGPVSPDGIPLSREQTAVLPPGGNDPGPRPGLTRRGASPPDRLRPRLRPGDPS